MLEMVGMELAWMENLWVTFMLMVGLELGKVMEFVLVDLSDCHSPDLLVLVEVDEGRERKGDLEDTLPD